jgi:hypothetical protein
VPNDRYGYRVALIESFRRWGILPTGLRTLSEEQLRWQFARMRDYEGWSALTDVAEKIRSEITETLYIRDRKVLFDKLREARSFTHDYLKKVMSDSTEAPHRPEFDRVTGLNLWRTGNLNEADSNDNEIASFEVHVLRPALRVSPTGTIMKQLILTLTQRRHVAIDPNNRSLGTFEFRGGATLIFDLEGDKPSLRYAITRPIDSEERLTDIRAYRKGKDGRLSLRDTYFGESGSDAKHLDDEPLCMLHNEG